MNKIFLKDIIKSLNILSIIIKRSKDKKNLIY